MLKDELPELKGIVTQDQFSTMQQVGDISSELSNDAREIHSKAQNVVNKSSQGLEMTTNVIDSMEKIESQSLITEENMNALIGRLQEIKQINKFITSISTQTHLLSVNASILAAKAGEYGMGFQILADEIRKLAEESKGSAKEIEELLSCIEKDKNKVSDSMHSMKASITIGSDAYVGAIEIFNSINQSASTNLGISQRIVDKARKQEILATKLK